MKGLFAQKPTKRRGRFKDITGESFGRLTVIQFMGVPEGKNQKAYWKCRCGCQQKTEVILSTSALITGNTKSCGCLRREISAESKTTHGFTGIPEFRVFCDILERCFNPNHKRFKDWGGRGIVVDQKWNTTDKFSAFLKEVGTRPSPYHQIERIDNESGYVKGNMKWATTKEQSRNRRSNVWVMLDGVKTCVRDASRVLGLSRWEEMKLSKAAKSSKPILALSSSK